MWRTNSGFTLLELLVSIGIMAVLTAGVISLIGQGSQKYSRDSRRQTDLESIRSALEMYRTDNGFYPTAGNYSSVLVPNYITALPRDPLASRLYGYVPGSCSGSRCATYTLCTALEKQTTAVAGCGAVCGSTCSYKITNP